MMVVDDTLAEDHRAYVKHLLSTFDMPSPPPYIIEADNAAECIANGRRSRPITRRHDRSRQFRDSLYGAGERGRGCGRAFHKPVEVAEVLVQSTRCWSVMNLKMFGRG